MSIHSFRPLYQRLSDTVRSDHWWPGDSDFEIAVGAILTQNTTWRNVEMAIANLREISALCPERLLSIEESTLASAIRPSGYFRTKSRYLRAMAEWFLAQDSMARTMDTETLRQSLLSVKGIGFETADDILLYIYRRPVFIYDLYARRLLKIVGLGDYKTYDAAKKALDPVLEQEHFSVGELAHFHGLIVDGSKQARQQGGWERLLEIP